MESTKQLYLELNLDNIKNGKFVLFKFNDGRQLPISLNMFMKFKNICTILEHHDVNLGIDVPEKFKYETFMFISGHNCPKDLSGSCELLLLNNYLGYDLMNVVIYHSIAKSLTDLDFFKLKINYFGPYPKEEYDNLAYYYWLMNYEPVENLFFERTLTEDFFQIPLVPNIFQLKSENIFNILQLSKHPFYKLN